MSILWFQIATTEFLKASEKEALILAENLSPCIGIIKIC